STHARSAAGSSVEQTRFRNDWLTTLQQRDLTLYLMVDRTLHIPQRVHVLHFHLLSKCRGTFRHHRDIGVAPKRSFLHVAVTDTEIAYDLSYLGQQQVGFFRIMHVGFRYILDQRNTGTVEVDKRVGFVR